MASGVLVFFTTWVAAVLTVAAHLVGVRTLDRLAGPCGGMLHLDIAIAFVGLALGASLAGRRARASARPMRAVAILLGLLALHVTVLPRSVALFAGIFSGTSGPTLGARLPFELLAVGPALLGATLPYLLRSRIHAIPVTSARTGACAAALALGILSAPALTTHLLVWLGEASSGMLLGAVGGALAIAAFWRAPSTPQGEGPPEAAPLGLARDGRLPLGGAAVIGFVGACMWMALRPIVTLAVGSPLLAPPLMGLTLGVGLLAGALLGGYAQSRLREPGRWLSVGLLFFGICLVAAVESLGGLPALAIGADAGTGRSRLLYLGLRLLLLTALPTMFLASTLAGVVRGRASWTGAASDAGAQVATSLGLGALLGAVLMHLAVLPHRGPAGGLLVAGIVALAAAPLLRLLSSRPGRIPGALILVLPLAGLLLVGRVPGALASGPTGIEAALRQRTLPVGLSAPSREALAEVGGDLVGRPPRTAPAMPAPSGPLHALVTPRGTEIVGGDRGTGSVFEDGQARPDEAGVLLGLLPTLLTERTERALAIGYGGGWSVEGLRAGRAIKIDVLVQYGPHFRAERLLMGGPSRFEGDPRVRFHHGPTRPYLAAAAEDAYDVIACDLPPAHQDRGGTLLTTEGLELIASRLAPGGVVSLRVPLGGLASRHLVRIVATVRAHLPTVWIWGLEDGVLLVAAREPLTLEPTRWRTRLEGTSPAARTLLQRARLDTPARVVRRFVVDQTGAERLASGDLQVHADGTPALAYDAAWSALERNRGTDALAALDAHFPPDFGALLPDAATRERWLTDVLRSWHADDARRARFWARGMLSAKGVGFGVSRDALALRAQIAADTNQPVEAASLWRLARQQAPDDAELAAGLVGVLVRAMPSAEQRDATLEEIETLVTRFPDDGPVQAAAARAFADLDAFDRSAKAFEAARAAARKAPAGTGILEARRRLVADRPHADVLAVMQDDPALYEDPDALELYLGLLPALDHGTRREELTAALETLRRERAETARQEGREALHRGAYGEAAALLREALRQGPRQSGAWRQLAVASLLEAASGEPARVAVQLEAAAGAARTALGRAIRWAKEPATMRARAERILLAFGLSTAGLDGAPEADED
jgi:tetratricopeptide (TPR) repeat protein